MAWYVYLLKCSDGTLYTGITNNVNRRVKEHNMGIGSRYTRGRRPVELVASMQCIDKSAALKCEYRIKKLKREEKLAIFQAGEC